MTSLNDYDNLDVVRRECVILADSLKLAVYTVAVPNIYGEVKMLDERQVHMTFDNTIMVAMTGSDALKFADFILDLEPNPRSLPWSRGGRAGLIFYVWRPEGTDKTFYAAKNHDQVLALLRSDAEAKLFANQMKRWIV